ncbi:Uncharacterized protein TCM_031594 [Theobroma cacao]|uniref:Uncharacterized protein n=1 Tax=Theobroma cacao TaxID=3641 RepID=A0A061F8N1_THECC|nr:Uncharacterized protein TCM_031594 [Theobroma cacao]
MLSPFKWASSSPVFSPCFIPYSTLSTSVFTRCESNISFDYHVYIIEFHYMHECKLTFNSMFYQDKTGGSLQKIELVTLTQHKVSHGHCTRYFARYII